MVLVLFFKLLIGHALADFPLQGDHLARFKNYHNTPIAPPGQNVQTIWPYCLSAHALIHGGAVYIITGSLWLAVAETTLHWVIDFAKCANWTGIHADQALHVACKLAWAFIA